MVKKNYHAARWSAAALAAALLAGCASDVKLDQPAPVETRTPTELPAEGSTGGAAGAAGAGQSGGPTADAAQRSARALAALNALPRVIYFDYDSYVVKDEYRALLDSHAKALALDRGRKVSVQGHTDERGGREYNLALGQRRAEAVVRSLSLLGVADSQMEAVSFGKERPAEPGVDEASWAKNRRAELSYR
jgi:peptidoglycan-associated lipoprotein